MVIHDRVGSSGAADPNVARSMRRPKYIVVPAFSGPMPQSARAFPTEAAPWVISKPGLVLALLGPLAVGDRRAQSPPHFSRPSGNPH
jgi:hypothetical protein